MAKKTIQTDVVIGEKEELFFKEVVFDFDSLPPETGITGQTPNLASRLFMIQNVDESIKVKAYPTRDNAIMFNAWITKNISYKIAAQRPKDPKPIIPITDPLNPQEEDILDPPSPIMPPVEMVGIGMKDSAGYPTIYGALYHMTKIIDFGGFIKLDLPCGERLRESDIVEVLCAEIVGSHDELLDPEPIYEPYQSTTTTNVEVMIPLPPDPLDPDAPPKYIKMILPVPTTTTKYKQFDPKLKQYARLREKMCVKIKVKVTRKETVYVDCHD